MRLCLTLSPSGTKRAGAGFVEAFITAFFAVRAEPASQKHIKYQEVVHKQDVSRETVGGEVPGFYG